MINRFFAIAAIICIIGCHGGSDNNDTKPNTPKSLPTQGYFRTTKTAQPSVQMSAKEGVAFASQTPAVNRVKHQATVLSDGRVLLSGGTPSANDIYQIFDPVTETFSTLEPQDHNSIHRDGHAVVKISDTKYLIIGGDGDVIYLNKSRLELFDSTTNKVELLPVALEDADNTVFSYENAWAAIKIGNNVVAFTDSGSGKYWVIDLTTWTYETRTSSYLTKRSSPNILMSADNQSVYLLGGWDKTTNIEVPLKDVVVLGLDLNFSKLGEMKVGRAYCSSVILPNNKLGIYGGTIVSGGESTDSVEEYDLTTNTSAVVGTLQLKGAGFQSQILQNGYVFHGGGVTDFGKLITNAQQIFDHASDLSGFTNVMNRARIFFTSTMLNNGRLLIVGGEKLSEANPIAEIFEPNAGIYIKLPSNSIPLGETINLAVEYSGASVAFVADRGTLTNTQSKNTDITMPDSFGNGLVKVTVNDPNNSAINKAEVYLKLTTDVVSISTTTDTFVADQQYQFTALVNYFADKTVTWSTNQGTITSTGLFTMPTSHTTPIVIKAKINASSKKVWEATFEIQ